VTQQERDRWNGTDTRGEFVDEDMYMDEGCAEAQRDAWRDMLEEGRATHEFEKDGRCFPLEGNGPPFGGGDTP